MEVALKLPKVALYISDFEVDGRTRLERLKAWVLKQGWEVVGIFLEDFDGRAAFERLLDEGRARRFTAVVIDGPETFHTSRDLYTALAKLGEMQMHLVCRTEPSLDTTSGQPPHLYHIAKVMTKLDEGAPDRAARRGAAKARLGKRRGRPRRQLDVREIRERRWRGETLQDLAKSLDVSISTLQRRLRE